MVACVHRQFSHVLTFLFKTKIMLTHDDISSIFVFELNKPIKQTCIQYYGNILYIIIYPVVNIFCNLSDHELISLSLWTIQILSRIGKALQKMWQPHRNTTDIMRMLIDSYPAKKQSVRNVFHFAINALKMIICCSKHGNGTSLQHWFNMLTPKLNSTPKRSCVKCIDYHSCPHSAIGLAHQQLSCAPRVGAISRSLIKLLKQ